jgi:hypothetical protein
MKIKILILTFISLSLLSCEEKKIKKYHIDNEIQSLRVDDDPEYHVSYITPDGIFESRSDLKQMNLVIKYGNYEKPIIRDFYSNAASLDGTCFFEGKSLIMLPVGYKIETFED